MRHYPAKLLLFGEHLLLRGATALATPVPHYYGTWAQKAPLWEPRQWRQLSSIARRWPTVGPQWIDLPRLKADLTEGWFLRSNIPQGYGLGSSGALCAALYDRYGLDRLPDGDFAALKQRLADMEAVFHGRSSGIDPLTAYLQQTLLIEQGNSVRPLPQHQVPEGIQVFLLDTEQPRQTAPLVQWFLAQSETPVFGQMLDSEVMPAHQRMVNAWLSGETAIFWQQLAFISRWQWEQLKPMLPNHPELCSWWSQTLQEADSDTYFKICGAGGGGFLLGFTQQPEAVRIFADQRDLSLVFPFR
jgi:mevalonate kinase